jgi:chromosome segregation ATPase
MTNNVEQDLNAYRVANKTLYSQIHDLKTTIRNLEIALEYKETQITQFSQRIDKAISEYKSLQERFAESQEELMERKAALKGIQGKVNLNDKMYFTLTEDGREFLEENGIDEERVFKVETYKDTTYMTGTLWEVMNIFGDEFCNGCPNVIETTFYVKAQ